MLLLKIGGIQKSSPTKIEEPNLGGSAKIGDPNLEEPKIGSPKIEEPKIGGIQMETPNLAGPIIGGSKIGDTKIAEPKIEGPISEGPKIEDTQKGTISTENKSTTTFIQQLKVLAENLAFFQVPYLVRTVMFSLAIYNEQFVFECSYRTLGEMFNLSPSNKARVYSIIKSLPGTRIIRGKAGTNTIVDLTAFVSKSFTEGTTNLVDTNIGDTKIVDTNSVGTNLVGTKKVSTKRVDTNLVGTDLGDTKKVDTKLVGAVSSSSYINNIIIIN